MTGYFTIVVCMIFCHIIDDFVLQGICLVHLKQKAFWNENCPKELYKHDYIVAIIMHGFSWAFMIQLPFLILLNFIVDYKFLVLLILNTFIHAFIDHLKANKFKLNLVQDQLLHLLQIVYTALFLSNIIVR